MMKKILMVSGISALMFVTVGAVLPDKKNSSAPSLGEILSEAHAAQVDYFLKIDGIDGESTDNKHKDKIDVLSWSWGATQMGSHTGGGGGGAGKVSMQDFHFTKKVDKSTPKLMEAVAKGQHIREATLVVRSPIKRGKNPEFLTIKLENILVSSYQIDGPSNDIPTESISLNFEKIQWSYVDPTGKLIGGGWDIGANTQI